MPEATRDIQDNLELEARVSDLLDELAAAQASADQLATLASTTLANGAPPPAAPAPAAPRPTVHAEAGTAVAIAPVPTILPPSNANPPPTTPVIERSSNAAPAPEPEAAARATRKSTEEDLAQAVEKLIAESAPAPAPPSPGTAAPMAAAAAETGKIESLDAELAGLADDLIAGEFADEETVLAASPTAPGAAPESTVAAETTATAPASATPVIPLAAVTEPPAPAVTSVTSTETGRPVAEATQPVIEEAEPSVMLRAAAALSAPLRGRPQYVRSVIAWFALVNAFLAFCVWAWVLVFRPAEAPPPVATEKHGAEAKPSKDETGSAPKSKKATKGSAPKQAKASNGH